MLLLELFFVGVGALVGGWICRRMGVPEVLGYLAAGILLGPHTHATSFVHEDSIKAIAQFGVVFRMFTLGLDFDTRRLQGRWKPALSSGVLEMVACTLAGLALAAFLGWSPLEGAILGAALGTTSTSILSKALADRGMSSREDARAAGAGTLTEDLIAMCMLALLAVFHGAQGPAEVLEAAIWLVVFACLAFSAGAILVPVGLDKLGRSRSDELMTLAPLGVLFGFAAASELLGAGRAVGSFLAGIAVGSARHAANVTARILPLRDVLAATAYVAIGLLLDPRVILAVAPIAIVVAVVFVAIKITATSVGLALGGVPPPVAARAGAILGQSGTMGLILACSPFLSNEAAGRLMAFAFVAWAFTVALTPLRLRWLPDIMERVARLLGAHERMRRPVELRRTPDRDARAMLYAAFLAAGCAVGLTALAAIAAKAAFGYTGAFAWPLALLAGGIAGALVLPFGLVSAVSFRRALRTSVHRAAMAPARLSRGVGEGRRAWSVTGALVGFGVCAACVIALGYAVAPGEAAGPLAVGGALPAIVLVARPRWLARMIDDCEALVAQRPEREARVNDFRGVAPLGVEVEGHVVRQGTRPSWARVAELEVAKATGARIVAVLRSGSREPSALTKETVVHPGDELVLAGTPSQLAAARAWLLEASGAPVQARS